MVLHSRSFCLYLPSVKIELVCDLYIYTLLHINLDYACMRKWVIFVFLILAPILVDNGHLYAILYKWDNFIHHGRIKSHCFYTAFFHFIHASVDGHLAFCHLLAVVSSAVISTSMQHVTVVCVLWFLWVYTQEGAN